MKIATEGFESWTAIWLQCTCPYCNNTVSWETYEAEIDCSEEDLIEVDCPSCFEKFGVYGESFGWEY
jgi:endogenous inhibitor of DNA gyrase (YacG/DUF329 family)